MKDKDAILEAIDKHAFWESRIGELRPNSKGWSKKITCPFCAGDKKSFSFSVNVETGAFNCFRCGGGGIIDWVMKTEGCGFLEALRKLGGRSDYDEEEIKKRKAEKKEAHRQKIWEMIIFTEIESLLEKLRKVRERDYEIWLWLKNRYLSRWVDMRIILLSEDDCELRKLRQRYPIPDEEIDAKIKQINEDKIIFKKGEAIARKMMEDYDGLYLIGIELCRMLCGMPRNPVVVKIRTILFETGGTR